MKVLHDEGKFTFEMTTKQGLIILGLLGEIVENGGIEVVDEKSINELKGMLKIEEKK